ANKLPHEYQGLLTTVGKIDNSPNVVNVIPGKTTFKLDIRHPDDAIRKAAIRHYQKEIKNIASTYNVGTEVSVEWDSSGVHFHDDIQQAIQVASDTYGYSTHSMFSGPGHDAKYMSLIAKTGMILVKSINGISHNEQDYTPDEELEKS